MDTCLPAARFPLGKMRPFHTERGVVAMSGVDDRRVAVDVEDPAGYAAEKLLEVAFLPCLANTAGKQAVAGEQVRGVIGGVERQGDGSGCVTLQMDDVERQLADLDGVTVGQVSVRLDRQRLGVELMRCGRHA